jgi:predicted transcriptional regulator
VRTTLTLDDDVSAKLEAEARRTGKSFRQTVNEALRAGLNARRVRPPAVRFVVRARALGLRRGLSMDNVGQLLEHAEGDAHR